MSGGNYTYFNVVAGLTYTWNTCGDTDFDTELTLFQGNGCGGTVLAYNDNYCGDQSQITWTATFTGVVTILLTEMDYTLWVIPDPCQTNSGQMTLTASCADMPVGCSDAAPFCTGTTYAFPLMVGATAEVGPDYACLLSQPSPVWYYMLVDNPGNIIIYIESPTGNDVDFICWGPFSSPTGACTAGLTSACGASCPNNTTNPSFYPSGMTVDCSFDIASNETCHILGALSGEYYMLCITNFDDVPGNIEFSQTGGTGTTNCNIVFCDMTNISGLASACDPITNDFSIDGSITFNNQPTTGQLIVTDNSGATQTFNAPFTSPTSYSLTGINSDGALHTITAYFTDAPTCQLTFDYTAPTACTSCSANAGVDQSVCGLSATLAAVEQVGDINTGWTSADPGVAFSDANSPSSSVTVPSAGAYTFVWTITNSAGSTCSDSVVVTFIDLPSVSFSGDPLSGCVPVTVQFQGNSGASVSTWSWQFGDGQSSTDQNPLHTYSNPGLFTVSLSVTSTDNCSNSVYITNYIDVAAYPIASFITSPSVVYEDNPSILFIDQSTGATSWWWDFGEPGSGDVSAAQNPAYTYQGTGSYSVTLIVANAQGCIDSISSSVQIKPAFTFYMPTSFSPNSDDRNDLFIPYGIGWDLNTFQMRIYDRWGELIYATHDINKGWDGNFADGTKATPGVYAVRVWLNAIDGAKHYYDNTVVLIH
jgi:gliding motility-associated-like protein